MVGRVGQQLGNYRLTRLLGKGGFAEVYLGEHVYLETQAAIKVLHTQLADEHIEPFRLEAKRVAHLEHPHIVRVLEFGVEGTTPFLVMSYASGGSLRHRHPKGTQLPLTTILVYVRQVAAAVQYAHNQQLIHRDIKPENMLLGYSNEVLLSDFGLVLIAQSSGSQTTKEMAGTIPYMAPEQIQGKPRKASDQYALGIVVYEWLSGNYPFQGSALEIATQHLFVAPPALRTKNPIISQAVEEVVLKALAKDPQQRFADVRAFATAIEQAYHAELGESTGLLEMPPSEEEVAPDDSSHSRDDESESIFWTRIAMDSNTIQRDEQVVTSDKRSLMSDQTSEQALPASTFLFNQPLPDPSEFYGRARERETLLNRTRNGASTSIVGPRRVGKTWLMSYLKLVAGRELGTRFHVGYLDATTARCATVVGFTAIVFEVLALQRRTFDVVDDGLALLEQVVQELTSKNQFPVLCIDEFEGFSDRQVFNLHFFTALRAMTQTGLSLVIASKSPLIDIVGDYGKTSGFFNVFEQLTIKPFSAKEAERFVQNKGTQAHFTEQERMHVLQFGQQSGEYWPLRLQLVGKMLLEDKILAVKEKDADYYRPNDPSYWHEFEKRLEETYRGVVR